MKEIQESSCFCQIKVWSIYIILAAFFIPNIYSQCDALDETTIEIDAGDDCETIVTWEDPEYSLLCPDFTDTFDFTNNAFWSIIDGGGNGLVDTTLQTSSFTIQGSADGSMTDIDTDLCFAVPFDGKINFEWSGIGIGVNAELVDDEVAFTLNGVETILNELSIPAGGIPGTGVSVENGNVANLEVSAGQQFCFRVKSDNTGDTTIATITNFVFEINQVTQIGGIVKGSLQDVGLHIAEYQTVNCNGDFDTCNITISVKDFTPPAFLCNQDVNISLDILSCQGELIPAMIIDTTSINCSSACAVTIVNNDGTRSPALFDKSHIGNSYIYEICCGDVCCQGNVDVEYNIEPLLQCRDTVRVSCATALNDTIGIPNIDDFCTTVKFHKYDESPNIFDCDTLYSSSVKRTWTAEDQFGNISDACQQIILFERAEIANIDFPDNRSLQNQNPLDCNTNYTMTDQGYPIPQEVGVPIIEISPSVFVDLYPFKSTLICHGYVAFQDVEVLGSNTCVTKIKRTWTIGEFHCSNPDPITHVQYIEIVDQSGPIINSVGNYTMSTQSFECGISSPLRIPIIQDNCNNDNGIKLDVGFPNGFITDYEGQAVDLDLGSNRIIYNAYDKCGNVSSDTIFINVSDLSNPIPICNTDISVSLTLQSEAILEAGDLDNGSFDECGDITLRIARMDAPLFPDTSVFGQSVSFTCDDVGSSTMVALLVSDIGGNSNMCMSAVEVQDKIEPSIQCLSDMQVECNFVFDENNLASFFGAVNIEDNCPDQNSLVDRIISNNLTNCGTGELIREIILLDKDGNEVQKCTQQIVFQKDTKLDSVDITWPTNEIEFEGCIDDISFHENVPQPQIADGICQQVGMRFEDEEFPFNSSGSCQKIIRTYEVIDWCLPTDSLGGASNPFTFEQIIKVINKVAPTFIQIPIDTLICNYSIDCSAITISDFHSVDVDDDCTAQNELISTYEVTDSLGNVIRTGNGLNPGGTFDIGIYNVTYTVEDKCGNTNRTSAEFEIRNCKNPTPYCINGLSTSLHPEDTDNDGVADNKIVVLNPEYFNGGSFHPCGYDIQFSFSQDVDSTSLVLDCDDIGEIEVQLWVTDQFNNQDYCTTTLTVQDNDSTDICNNLLISKTKIEGLIVEEDNSPISDVTVSLRGAEVADQLTDMGGYYLFENFQFGGSFQVVPNKKSNNNEGINTLDLVKIQRHILQLEELTSPYKIIAADVNNDNKIRANDLLVLRKVILGIDDEFPINRSWRFLDKSHNFKNPSNPFENMVDENYVVNNIKDDERIDFIGIKVGDVDRNDNEHNRQNLDVLPKNNLRLTARKRTISNYEVEYEFSSSESNTIAGLQLELNIGTTQLVDVDSHIFDVSLNNTNVVKNTLLISFANGTGKHVEANEILFTIVLQNCNHNECHISTSGEFLQSEIYLLDDNNELKTNIISINSIDEQKGSTSVEVSINPNPCQSNCSLEIYAPTSGIAIISIVDSQSKMIYKSVENVMEGFNKIQIRDIQQNHQSIMFYKVQIDDKIYYGKMLKI